jgi:hypothetical protein
MYRGSDPFVFDDGFHTFHHCPVLTLLINLQMLPLLWEDDFREMHGEKLLLLHTIHGCHSHVGVHLRDTILCITRLSQILRQKPKHQRT